MVSDVIILTPAKKILVTQFHYDIIMTSHGSSHYTLYTGLWKPQAEGYSSIRRHPQIVAVACLKEHVLDKADSTVASALEK